MYDVRIEYANGKVDQFSFPSYTAMTLWMVMTLPDEPSAFRLTIIK